ncbi:hypothetical protein, partial [Lutibacter sp.]
MKKKLLYFSIAAAIFSFSIYLFVNGEISTKKEALSIETLRSQHAKYLSESPFKATLGYSKQERLAHQLPPNKY